MIRVFHVRNYQNLYFSRSQMNLSEILHSVGGTTVPFDILAEFLPAKQRGKYLLYTYFFWTAGSMAVPVLGYLSFGSGKSWQLFVLLCAIPCSLSVICGLLFVPESPRWLVSKGREEEALAILREGAITNGRNGDYLWSGGGSVKLIKEQVQEESNFAVLFQPKWRRLTLLLWAVWFGFGFGYYGIILTITRVFEDDSNNSNTNVPEFDFVAIFISCSAELVGLFLVINTVDRLGRVQSQVWSYLLAGMFVFLLSNFSLNNDSLSRVFLTFFAFMARSFEMGASCMTWVCTAEVLSTEIRTTGHSAANALARVGGFICPYLIGSDVSLATIGWVMLGIHIGVTICSFHLPETKGLALGIHHDGDRHDTTDSQAPSPHDSTVWNYLPFNLGTSWDAENRPRKIT